MAITAIKGDDPWGRLGAAIGQAATIREQQVQQEKAVERETLRYARESFMRELMAGASPEAARESTLASIESSVSPGAYRNIENALSKSSYQEIHERIVSGQELDLEGKSKNIEFIDAQMEHMAGLLDLKGRELDQAKEQFRMNLKLTEDRFAFDKLKDSLDRRQQWKIAELQAGIAMAQTIAQVQVSREGFASAERRTGMSVEGQENVARIGARSAESRTLWNIEHARTEGARQRTHEAGQSEAERRTRVAITELQGMNQLLGSIYSGVGGRTGRPGTENYDAKVAMTKIYEGYLHGLEFIDKMDLSRHDNEVWTEGLIDSVTAATSELGDPFVHIKDERDFLTKVSENIRNKFVRDTGMGVAGVTATALATMTLAATLAARKVDSVSGGVENPISETLNNLEEDLKWGLASVGESISASTANMISPPAVREGWYRVTPELENALINSGNEEQQQLGEAMRRRRSLASGGGPTTSEQIADEQAQVAAQVAEQERAAAAQNVLAQREAATRNAYAATAAPTLTPAVVPEFNPAAARPPAGTPGMTARPTPMHAAAQGITGRPEQPQDDLYWVDMLTDPDIGLPPR